MGCTQSKITSHRRHGNIAVMAATPREGARRRTRSDSLKKIPTRLFAVWSGATTSSSQRSQQRAQSPMPSASSNAMSLLAPPGAPSAANSSCHGSEGFTCLRDAASQEDSLVQLDADRERTRNEYEDFGSPPQSTVEAYDHLDFDVNPMDDGSAAAFY